MQNLIKMYPKATIELLDKCFENVGRLSFRHGDENSEYFYYDFVFLMSHGGTVYRFLSILISTHSYLILVSKYVDISLL
jgi:hypothetical protein